MKSCVRTKGSQHTLTDTAVEIHHQSHTDFILETIYQATEDVILDRRTF